MGGFVGDAMAFMLDEIVEMAGAEFWVLDPRGQMKMFIIVAVYSSKSFNSLLCKFPHRDYQQIPWLRRSLDLMV